MGRTKRKTAYKEQKQKGQSSPNSRRTSVDSESGGLNVNGGLHVTSCQLRELWCFDHECGSKYVRGCPRRTCTSLEECSGSSNDSVAVNGLSPEEMVQVKSKIEEMWKKAGSLFEVFMSKEEEQAGFRLRVRKDLAMNVSIKRVDQFHIGWIAIVPAEASPAHVYNRSPVAPDGYLGGPASYLNWCPTKEKTTNILKSVGKDCNFMCYMYTSRPLKAGTELRWDYGCSRHMPDCGVWFKDECCRTVNVAPADLKRLEVNQKRRTFVYRELCVLCGFAYSIENKDNAVKRKKHLANKHADFLGSTWDGKGTYMQQTVCIPTLFQKVDELNHLLTSLKQMRWNVLPACKIFTRREQESFGADVEALMDEFNRRKDLFKRGGTLVLRESDIPSSASDFEPIKPSNWKVLTWEGEEKPINGRYAVQNPSTDHHFILNNILQEFCEKYFQECAVESDCDND